MKNKLIKNKKADIPVTILAIMVVAICILAILSFISSGQTNKPDYLGVGLIEEINANVEKFYFYLNVGFSEDEAAEKIGADIMGNRLIINRAKIVDEKKIISIEYNMSVVR